MIKIILFTVFMSGYSGQTLRIDHIEAQEVTAEQCAQLERNERVAIKDGRDGFIVASCIKTQEL